MKKLKSMLAFARVNDAAGTIGKITLEGEILPSEWSMWSDGTANTPQLMREQLAALGDVERIELHINSQGGSVTDGIAIMNALAQHDAPVAVHVDGVAASIASVIVMAADPGQIHMPANTLMFVHPPWTYTVGNADDLEKDAAALRKMEAAIVASYKRHCEKSAEDVLAIMKAETWLTAAECADLFGATVIDEPMQIAAALDLSRLGDVPEAAKAWALTEEDGQGEDGNADDNATGNDAGQDGQDDGGAAGADGNPDGQDGDDGGQDDGAAAGEGDEGGADNGGQEGQGGGGGDGSDGAPVENQDGQDGAGDGDGQDNGEASGNDAGEDGNGGGDAGAPTEDTANEPPAGGDDDAPDADGNGAEDQANQATPPTAKEIAALQKKDPGKLAKFIDGLQSRYDKLRGKYDAIKADMKSLTGAHETQMAALTAQHAEALETAKTELAAEHAEEIETLTETNQAMKAKLDTLTTGGFTFHGSVDSWDDAVSKCGGGDDGYVKARKAYPQLYAEFMRQAALKTGDK